MPDGRAGTEGEPDWKGNCGGETASIKTDDARRCFAPTGTRRIAPIATGGDATDAARNRRAGKHAGYPFGVTVRMMATTVAIT